jgi:hypothetical protein
MFLFVGRFRTAVHKNGCPGIESLFGFLDEIRGTSAALL